MVRILANGAIVPDDDPRAQQSRRNEGGGPNIRTLGSFSSSNQGSSGASYRGFGSSAAPGQRFTGGQGGYGGVNHDYAGEGQVQQVSIFEVLNQKLLGLGLPRMNVFGHVIEPIVTIAFVLAMLFFGLPGLLFGVILFAVVKVSQNGQQNLMQPGTQYQMRR